jgi:hypothetical protein
MNGIRTTAAPTGRKKVGHRPSASDDSAKPPAALGHESQKPPSPEGAKERRRLPEGWRWARMSEVCSRVQDGTHFSPKEQTAAGDFKYITAKNIKHWGLDLTELTYVPAHVHREIYSRCNPEQGDVLYIKDGVTTGVAIHRENIRPGEMLLPLVEMRPSKIAAFEGELEHLLRAGRCSNEFEVMQVCFEHGVKRQHAEPVLAKLKRDGVIELNFRVPDVRRCDTPRPIRSKG